MAGDASAVEAFHDESSFLANLNSMFFCFVLYFEFDCWTFFLYTRNLYYLK